MASGRTVLQRMGEQGDRLRRARTEHDVLRIGEHAAGASKIVGHRVAGGGQTLRFDVAERLRTDLGEALRSAPQPGGAGSCRDPVSRERSRRRSVASHSALRCAGRVDGGHPGAGAMPAQQKALGHQLAVRVHDEPPGDPEVGREHPGRRQPGVWGEPAGPDGGAQPVGELAVQRLRRGAVEFDQELWTGSGTRNRHESGAYLEAIDELA